jgi:hypothetical protein
MKEISRLNSNFTKMRCGTKYIAAIYLEGFVKAKSGLVVCGNFQSTEN